MSHKYLMELLGTFFLTLTVCLSGHPLAIGIMLMALVYIGGHISGGHYNPAVTLSVWLRGKLSFTDVPFYIVSQTLGAFAAAGLFFVLAGKTFYPAPSPDVTLLQAVLLEALFTFVFCLVILTVATARKFATTDIYGIAIGLTLFTAILTVGPTTGGAFNPAVGVGTILCDLVSGSGAGLKYLVLYIVGPSLGGIGAAYAFKFLNPGE